MIRSLLIALILLGIIGLFLIIYSGSCRIIEHRIEGKIVLINQEDNYSFIPLSE